MAGVAATIGVGLAMRWGGSTALGTPLPPFLMSWAPHLRWPAAIAAVVAIGVAVSAPRLIDRLRSTAAFAGLAYAGALAVGLAVGAARRGTAGWAHVFDLSGHGSFEAGREYLPALGQLRGGIGHYVSHFADLLPYLPTHTKGNPPGPLVAMRLFSITSATRLTVACIALGALSAPLTYALGRVLGGEGRGRTAAALAVLSPALVLFGVTSVDYTFAALSAAGAWLLVTPRPAARAAGCVVVALGSFFSWLLLAIPVWAVVVVWRREGGRQAASVAAASAGAIVAFTLLLAVVWGYDPVAVIRALRRIYAEGAAAHRPYAFWLFGSPAAWLAMLGLPVAWAALRAGAAGDAAAVALGVVVVVSAIAGVTKAETERIWLPYVPLACVAAAATPIRPRTILLTALAAQGVAVEVLFGTVW